MQAGFEVTADASITGSGHAHVITRTSNFNPIEELWASGDLTIVGNLNFMARVYSTYSNDLGPWDLVEQVCAAPICMGGSLAGISIDLGISAPRRHMTRAHSTSTLCETDLEPPWVWCSPVYYAVQCEVVCAVV